MYNIVNDAIRSPEYDSGIGWASDKQLSIQLQVLPTYCLLRNLRMSWSFYEMLHSMQSFWFLLGIFIKQLSLQVSRGYVWKPSRCSWEWKYHCTVAVLGPYSYGNDWRICHASIAHQANSCHMGPWTFGKLTLLPWSKPVAADRKLYKSMASMPNPNGDYVVIYIYASLLNLYWNKFCSLKSFLLVILAWQSPLCFMQDSDFETRYCHRLYGKNVYGLNHFKILSVSLGFSPLCIVSSQVSSTDHLLGRILQLILWNNLCRWVYINSKV
jgi:hypothetical protein